MTKDDKYPTAGEFMKVQPGDTSRLVDNAKRRHAGASHMFASALHAHIERSLGPEPYEEDVSDRPYLNDEGEWAGGKTFMPWSEVCRLFDHKNLRKRHPGWEEAMDQCAIFDLSGVGDAQMRNTLSDDSFHETPMPFPAIAVILGMLTIVAKDVWLNEETSEMGGEILCFVRPHPDIPQMANVISGTLKWVPQGASGLSTVVETALQTDCIKGSPSYVLDDMLYALPDDLQVMPHDKRCDLVGAMFLLFATALSYINAPHHFVVEAKPHKLGKTKKGKTKRQHSRPRYIVLDKQAIHQRYLDSQPSGRKSPVPHLRRGHYRTLTAARYKAPGRRVWVRATNVKRNEVQWREGDRFYKVL